MIRLLCTTAAALALAAASCHAGTGGPGTEPVTLETIVQASNPGQGGERRQEVIRDDAAWRTAWSEIREGSSLPAEPPAVDFSREMVILAAMATQGCVARVTIGSVTPGGGELVIAVTEAPPAPNCVCITSERPIHIVRAPKLEGRPRFVVTQGQTSCGP
jgi:hypothetical protein